MVLIVSASFARHAAPLDFNPYNALAIIIVTVPFSLPNSDPATVHSFSRQSALRYALPISQHDMSKPFNDAISNAKRTLSLDTTLE